MEKSSNCLRNFFKRVIAHLVDYDDKLKMRTNIFVLFILSFPIIILQKWNNQLNPLLR